MDLNDKQKICFIGLSIGSDSSAESGISVIDKDLNLIKTDKAFQISEVKSIITNISQPQNTILCVDMPKNIMMLTGKWRIESKQTQILGPSPLKSKRAIWRTRFSDRGSDLCTHFVKSGMAVYRYNSYFTINMLRLNPPYKTRVPAGCKFLQTIIEERLGIKGMPSNLLPLPTLLSLVGAFTAWKISTSEKDAGYKQISEYKNLPVVSALNT